MHVQLDGHQISLGKSRVGRTREIPPADGDRANGVLPRRLATCRTGSLLSKSSIAFLMRASGNPPPTGTFETYRDRLRPFVRHLEERKNLSLEAAALRPFHVLEWLDAFPSWSAGMRRGGIQAVQRAFNWADEVGLIESSPIAKMRKPPPGKRDQLVSEDDYRCCHDGRRSRRLVQS